jgi:5,10-methylenetetrahydrofolate reductase
MKPSSGPTAHRHGTSSAPKPSTPKPLANPLRETIAHGKMPIVLELHLTENDRNAYQRLRNRHLASGAELTQLRLLGQYLRELDVEAADVSPEERSLVRKLQMYAELVGSAKVDLIALDDGARGRDALDNAIAAELLIGHGVEPTRLLANVVARNRQAEQIRNRLLHFAGLGLRNALLITGDLPVDPGKQASFPLDSIGMCELARQMIIEGQLPDDFLIAAAGHPNPDVDPEGLQALHKALAGARVLITQAMYAVQPFQRWMDALRRLGVLDMVHVFGEIIPITSSAQLKLVATVPGMRVPDDLIAELAALEARIETTARSAGHDEAWMKQRRTKEATRITRGLLHQIRRVSGVEGFYLGCVRSFDAHVELLKETPLVPDQAPGSHRTAKLSGASRQRALAQLPQIETLISRCISDAQRKQESTVRSTVRRWAESPTLQRALRVIEWPKVPLFGCQGCDRCDLSPDALVCPRGCAKQMTHGPCGAPRTVDGRVLCEDTSRECTWAEIRRRREQFGVRYADRLAVRPAPSPAFYQGERASSFAPVLAGTHPGPDWALLHRMPRALLGLLVDPGFRLPAPDDPSTLMTLVASKRRRIEAMAAERPDIDPEELLVKTLALIGSHEALHLVETRMSALGLPAEGTLAELSIRELFGLAEALPALRRVAMPAASSHPPSNVFSRCDELLRVLPEGARMRRALRRELANGLIQHIGSLGARVDYTDALLEGRNVDDFLQALTITREELQLSRSAGAIETDSLRVHFDRVHYKHHYRPPIALRRLHQGKLTDRDANQQQPAGAHSDKVAHPNAKGDSACMVIDVRQFGTPHQFRQRLREALDRCRTSMPDSTNALCLEPYRPLSRSLCWAFNAAFWKRLPDFEAATGISYDASIGGSTDHNTAYVRSTARALYDRIHAQSLDEQTLYVLEIGVASIERARVFLDEIHRLSDLSGTRHYDRITYLLADFSEETLHRSRAALTRHHPHVETVRIDAGHPARALEPYKGRMAHIHLCNVFDNLPTDRVALIDDRLYAVEGRLYLSRDALNELMDKYGLAADVRASLTSQLSQLERSGEQGVEDLLVSVRAALVTNGRQALDYVLFWMDLFNAFRFDERYVSLADNEPLFEAGELRITAAQVKDVLQGHGHVEVHVSQEALRGFLELVATLHPQGVLEVVDLFVQRIEEYRERFKGPAKYDGSTVNWLNGPLFRIVAEQCGYRVRFDSFKPFDPKSISLIMLASPHAHQTGPTTDER